MISPRFVYLRYNADSDAYMQANDHSTHQQGRRRYMRCKERTEVLAHQLR